MSDEPASRPCREVERYNRAQRPHALAHAARAAASRDDVARCAESDAYLVAVLDAVDPA
jgi:hypothetical protein